MPDPLDVVKKLRAGFDFPRVAYEFDRGTPQNDGLDRHWIRVSRLVGGRWSLRSFCFTERAFSLRGNDDQVIDQIVKRIYRECRQEERWPDEASTAPLNLDPLVRAPGEAG